MQLLGSMLSALSVTTQAVQLKHPWGLSFFFILKIPEESGEESLEDETD